MSAASFSFTIEGPPQGKERARRGLGGRFYTPKKTRTYENKIQFLAWVAMANKGLTRKSCWPTDARYAVHIDIFPSSGRCPDGDNVLKAVQDGLHGIVYDNDRRSVAGSYEVHAPCADNPRVEVCVSLRPPLGDPG